jgi:hypothetical protein
MVSEMAIFASSDVDFHGMMGLCGLRGSLNDEDGKVEQGSEGKKAFATM